MKVKIHPHAAQRIRERGTAVRQVRETDLKGSPSAAKFGRTKFVRVFAFGRIWNRKRYAKQQIEAFAAIIPDGWLVVTVIVKYF
jgi:hypothetical protein